MQHLLLDVETFVKNLFVSVQKTPAYSTSAAAPTSLFLCL